MVSYVYEERPFADLEPFAPVSKRLRLQYFYPIRFECQSKLTSFTPSDMCNTISTINRFTRKCKTHHLDLSVRIVGLQLSVAIRTNGDCFSELGNYEPGRPVADV